MAKPNKIVAPLYCVGAGATCAIAVMLAATGNFLGAISLLALTMVIAAGIIDSRIKTRRTP